MRQLMVILIWNVSTDSAHPLKMQSGKLQQKGLMEIIFSFQSSDLYLSNLISPHSLHTGTTCLSVLLLNAPRTL